MKSQDRKLNVKRQNKTGSPLTRKKVVALLCGEAWVYMEISRAMKLELHIYLHRTRSSICLYIYILSNKLLFI